MHQIQRFPKNRTVKKEIKNLHQKKICIKLLKFVLRPTPMNTYIERLQKNKLATAGALIGAGVAIYFWRKVNQTESTRNHSLIINLISLSPAELIRIYRI
jgi:hypothetical protein